MGDNEFAAIVRKFASFRLNRKLSDADMVQIGLWLNDVLKWTIRIDAREQKNDCLFMLHQMCSLIPIDEESLVLKTAMTIEMFVCEHGLVIEGPALNIAFDWCFAALHHYVGYNNLLLPMVHVLRALNAMLRNNPNAADYRLQLLDESRIQFLVMAFLRRSNDEERSMLVMPLARLMDTILSTFRVSVDISPTMRECMMYFLLHCLETSTSVEHPRGDMVQLSAALSGVRNLVLAGPWLQNATATRALHTICRVYMGVHLHATYIKLPPIDAIVPKNPYPEHLNVMCVNAPTPPYFIRTPRVATERPRVRFTPKSGYFIVERRSPSDEPESSAEAEWKRNLPILVLDQVPECLRAVLSLDDDPMPNIAMVPVDEPTPGPSSNVPSPDPTPNLTMSPGGPMMEIKLEPVDDEFFGSTPNVPSPGPTPNLTMSPGGPMMEIKLEPVDDEFFCSTPNVPSPGPIPNLTMSPGGPMMEIKLEPVDEPTPNVPSPGPTPNLTMSPGGPMMEFKLEPVDDPFLYSPPNVPSPGPTPNLTMSPGGPMMEYKLEPVDDPFLYSPPHVPSPGPTPNLTMSPGGPMMEFKLEPGEPAPDPPPSTIPSITMTPGGAVMDVQVRARSTPMPIPNVTMGNRSPDHMRSTPSPIPNRTMGSRSYPDNMRSTPRLIPNLTISSRSAPDRTRSTPRSIPNPTKGSRSSPVNRPSPVGSPGVSYMRSPLRPQRNTRSTPYEIPVRPARTPAEERSKMMLVTSAPPYSRRNITRNDVPGLEYIEPDWNVYPPDVQWELVRHISTYDKRSDGDAREQALLLLQTIWMNVDDKTMLQEFAPFIAPDIANPANLPNSHNLLCNILKDDCKNAEVALACLQMIFARCKPALFERKNAGLNEKFDMNDIVEEMHHGFCLSLGSTKFISVRHKVLKALATLAHNSNYAVLKNGLCIKIVRNIKEMVQYADPQVQVLALAVVNGILVHTGVHEIEDAFVQSNELAAAGETESYDDCEPVEFYASFEGNVEDEVASNRSRSWLIELCFRNLRDSNSTAPVMLESLQIIGAMCAGYFKKLIMPYLKPVAQTLRLALCNLDNLDVLCHAAKATEKFGVAMEKNYQLPGCLDESLQIWQQMLDLPLSLLVGSAEDTLRACGANCIGSIGEHTFELLPSKVQVLCITTALSHAVDEATCVQTAALRSISVLLMYPSARAFSGFVLDASNILMPALMHTNKTVRLRASWGVGNLSEALMSDRVANVCGAWGDAGVPQLLQEVLTGSMRGCYDIDRVKSNCVRALGNLLQMLLNAGTDVAQNSALHDGVTVLLRAAQQPTSLMKVRWNACYALGGVLKLSSVYYDHLGHGASISTRIFHALGWILKGCPNLKVRAKAAAALINCRTRNCFGSEYIMLWGLLASGLTSLPEVVKGPDGKFQREQLINQSCMTLAHLTQLVKREDLEMIADVLADGSHTRLVQETQFVYDRLKPEECAPLFAAGRHVAGMAQDIDVPQEQRMALEVLMTVFREA